MLMKFIAAVLLTMSAATAQAGVIVGSSTLLNDAGLSQLETWLGQGQLTLTNIFTKRTGSNSHDFHAAADGKGATFSLMSASMDGGKTWETIGGYNPLSWNSNIDYSYTVNPVDWTSFIFNLTDSFKWQQATMYQAYNNPAYGPTFGGGHDIAVDSSLSFVYSAAVTYGMDCLSHANRSNCGGRSIVDNSPHHRNFQIGALEVFTVAGFTPSPTDVPEPGSLALFGLGLLGLTAVGRRKALSITAASAPKAA